MKTMQALLAALLAMAAFACGAASGVITSARDGRGVITPDGGGKGFRFEAANVVDWGVSRQYDTIEGFRVTFDVGRNLGLANEALNIRLVEPPKPPPPPQRNRSGTVSSFDDSAGRGFIAVDGGGEVPFSARNVVEPTLYAKPKRGDKLAFALLGMAGYEPQVLNIKITQSAPAAAPAAPKPDDIGGARTGVVKQWDDQRGFGYIAPDRGGDPVYAHFSAIASNRKQLPVGLPVTYELQKGPHGIQATNIR